MVEINESIESNKSKEIVEIDETQKRVRINLYFNPPIRDYQQYLIFGLASSFIGLVIFIVSFVTNLALLILAFALFAIGGLLLYLFYTRKKNYAGKLVSDSELDELLEDDISKIKEYILERLNLDPSQLIIETIYTSYYYPKENSEEEDGDVKFGKDGIPRFSPIMIYAVNFSTEELVLFNLHFDFITGDILNEETIAFYYKDIVTFSTDSTITSVFLNKNITYESFTLFTSAGTSEKVILKDSTIVSSFKDYIPTSEPENVILALRKTLREKKI
ncbi:MAG: hypothetical protein HGN29_18300 [Asgard group archaeon]|nr:hypothetical protein [Asgard group archaeon]